jgi:hypothetical protein
MKRSDLSRLLVLVVASAALSSRGTATAQETNAAPRTKDYSAFRIITERNIFNGNRSGRSSRGSRETPRPLRVDAFALLGVMSYEKGRFAFFDGSSSEYRKTLKAEGTIADFKVLDIGGKSVKLDGKGKQIELRVGSQLRREDGGEWKVTEGGDIPSSSGGRSSGSASASDSSKGAGTSGNSDSSSSSGSGGVSEVLKRLLEQREKETK